jgi:pimeloyl-ACP methyl ester carboxylesterase
LPRICAIVPADAARAMIAFLDALELSKVDLLGFSIGGFVAQEIALIRPALVRRLVLAATGPKGAPGMHGWREDMARAARLDQSTPDSLLHIFFAPTATSRALGGQFLGRFMARRDHRDAPTSLAARDAQYDAIVEWASPITARSSVSPGSATRRWSSRATTIR